MRDKGSQKPADDDKSLDKKSSSDGSEVSDGTADEAASSTYEIIARSVDGNGAGKMVTNSLIETDTASSTGDAHPSRLNEDVDWSLTGILNNPSGVDVALKQNLAMMEQQTKDLIASGSVEDLLRALDENTRQLEMLKDRMEGNLSWLTNLA